MGTSKLYDRLDRNQNFVFNVYRNNTARTKWQYLDDTGNEMGSQNASNFFGLPQMGWKAGRKIGGLFYGR